MGIPVTPLFVPGDRPERFAKAAASGADAVIIDLEDAVAPEKKPEARRAAAQARPEGVPLFIRINADQSAWHAEDMAAVRESPAGIILPKAEEAASLASIRAAIGPGRPIIALIESVRGLGAARELARHASALAFGSIDYAADLGIAHTREALLWARSELAFASRLAGIAAPIDGVTATIGDDALTEADARHAMEMGFGGKLLIHPRQVPAARRGFAPSEAEITWAREVLSAEGDGAVQVGGMMIDAPVRIRAERILARAPKG
ncbi:HpcH/HpaI aldolase/citrate lyase family protein [Pararoseomonas baculiformis]|nr:CoA ester lyase [Pararoseomonas baculiformis]